MREEIKQTKGAKREREEGKGGDEKAGREREGGWERMKATQQQQNTPQKGRKGKTGQRKGRKKKNITRGESVSCRKSATNNKVLVR